MIFPQPTSPADVIVPKSGALSAQAIFELITHPDRKNLISQIGVAGASDGSAKQTLRLLHSLSWVLKTNSALASTLEAVESHIDLAQKLSERLPIWHPDKVWFICHADGVYWPCSATPYLTTLRQLSTWKDKVHWWSEMLRWSLELTQEHGIGLDINPSNFGLDAAGERLHYLDDEIFEHGDLKDVGEAAIHRIPQEPEVTKSQWVTFGQALGQALKPLLKTQYEWGQLTQAMRDYPLTTIFFAKRDELIAGFLATNKKRKTVRKKTKKICFISDIHANEPALAAVLQAASKFDVDQYICLGDIVGYGPHPHECIEMVGNLPEILFVRGNHDDSIGSGIPEDGSNRVAREAATWTRAQLNPEELQWLANLPLEHVFDQWMIVHGSPQDPHRFYGYVYEMTYKSNLQVMAERGLNVVFHGHNHIQFIYQRNGTDQYLKHAPEKSRLFQPDQRMLINPGSVGQPRDGDPRAAFAIWDQTDNVVHFHRVEYPVARTMQAILATDLPEMLASRLDVGQ